MTDQRLATVIQAVGEWCNEQDVPYNIVCDGRDLQGVMLYDKHANTPYRLLEDLAAVIRQQGIFTEVNKVRNGSVVAFSIEAISENIMSRMIRRIGRQSTSAGFAEKIDRAFYANPEPAQPTVYPVPQEPTQVDFFESAQRIVQAEEDRPRMRRNRRARPRRAPGRRASRGPVQRRLPGCDRWKKFDESLQEALDGLATPDDQQPMDLFKKFAQALKVLGDELGIGPIQDRLQEQGIHWKLSDDKRSIILYVINASTDAPQPVSRVSAETLDEPHEFENELLRMLDFARGQAPGAFEQEQERINDQQKAVSDVAKAAAEKEEPQSDIADRLRQDEAPETAAQIAASPKSTADNI